MGIITPTATMLIETACMAGRTVIRILTSTRDPLSGVLGGSQPCSDLCGWGERGSVRGRGSGRGKMGGQSSWSATA